MQTRVLLWFTGCANNVNTKELNAFWTFSKDPSQDESHHRRLEGGKKSSWGRIENDCVNPPKDSEKNKNKL